MKPIQIKRTVRQGYINFWRNGWVSVATILVMVLTLFVFGALFLSNLVLTTSLDQLKDKVDISVYMKTDANEEEILALKSSLENINEVSSVEYISREQTLVDFREKHKDNALMTQSLDELGENPFGASLNITANDPQNYKQIANFLDEQSYSFVDHVSYNKNEQVFDTLNSMIQNARASGFTSTLVLSVIAVLVTFNTIRMAIYTSKEEIAIMKLVGATRAFIRGPFLTESVIYAVCASLIALVFIWLPLWLGRDDIVLLFVPLSPAPNITGLSKSEFYGGPNLLNYFSSNLILISVLLLTLGILLAVISSSIATSRYLKEHK